MAESTPNTVPNNHPIGFWFFFWGEFAERCSYYGMRAILPLYMTAQLKLSDADATQYYSTFKMACYFLPLLGGFLADKYFGKYWTIVGFSVPYVMGQLCLLSESETMLIVALTLCAMGSGVIKPNISSLMGMTYDQERPGKEQLRASAFLWFYFSVNIGAFLSMLLLPIVRNHYGYQVAFAIPAGLMAAALAVFAVGKRYYAKEIIPPPKPDVVVPFAERFKSLVPLLGVFLLIVFFWVVYEHNDTQWVFFARDHIDLTLPSWLGGSTLAPDQFQFINSILVLVFAPLSAMLWLKIDPTGTRVPATRKIFVGFLFTAAAPATMAVAALQAEGGAKVSMLWIVLAYVVLTIGEVLVYGTGLDFSYSQAPKDMKSMITAVFLVTNALGNFVNILYAPMFERKDGKGYSMTAVEFFTCDTVIVLAAAVVFFVVGRKFNRSQVQGSPEVEMEKP